MIDTGIAPSSCASAADNATTSGSTVRSSPSRNGSPCCAARQRRSLPRPRGPDGSIPHRGARRSPCRRQELLRARSARRGRGGTGWCRAASHAGHQHGSPRSPGGLRAPEGWAVASGTATETRRRPAPSGAGEIWTRCAVIGSGAGEDAPTGAGWDESCRLRELNKAMFPLPHDRRDIWDSTLALDEGSWCIGRAARPSDP